MLPVSLHCPLLIAPSVFSKIYLLMAIPDERLNLLNTFLAQICIYKKINVLFTKWILSVKLQVSIYLLLCFDQMFALENKFHYTSFYIVR